MFVGVEVDVGVDGTSVGTGEGGAIVNVGGIDVVVGENDVGVNVRGTDDRVGISGSETGDRLGSQLLVANATKVTIRKTQENLFISFSPCVHEIHYPFQGFDLFNCSVSSQR